MVGSQVVHLEIFDHQKLAPNALSIILGLGRLVEGQSLSTDGKSKTFSPEWILREKDLITA